MRPFVRTETCRPAGLKWMSGVSHFSQCFPCFTRNASLHISVHFPACRFCTEPDHMITIHISSTEILMGNDDQIIILFFPPICFPKPPSHKSGLFLTRTEQQSNPILSWSAAQLCPSPFFTISPFFVQLPPWKAASLTLLRLLSAFSCLQSTF